MMPSLILLTAAAAVVFGSAFISMAAAEGVGVTGNNSNNTPERNQEMEVAKEEMQRANYFAYVMLINLAPSDLFRGSVTFLMPKDRTLAKNMMMRESSDVADFLLRHSIPSPLLMEHLQHFPTGSTLPSCRSKQPHDQLLRITNNGRRSFFLNNVRIIRPNICTMGSSIRCHGIDGVIQDSAPTPPSAADECHNSNNNSSSTTPPPPPSPSSASSDKKNDTSCSSGPTTAEAPKGVEGPHPNKSAANSVVVERKWCYFGV